MNALVLALAAVLSGFAAPPADDVWITIDRDVLVAFERGGEAWEATPNDPADVTAPRPQVVAVSMSESRIGDLASFIHERYRRCGGFIAHGSRQEALDAAATAAMTTVFELAPPPAPYTIDNRNVARALAAEVGEANIRNVITDLSSFFTRYHACPSGQQAALWIGDLWQSYAQGRSDVSVELYGHNNTPQPSVILTIQGYRTPSEVVVIGGHQDSVAGSNCATSRAPGADDDASGIATISEIIRAAMLLGYQPEKTVKFMAYAAEEVGLLGSDHIARQYRAAQVNVVGVLQFDMTNYSDVPNADIVFYNDFTNAAQNAFLKDLANTYLDSPNVYQPRLTSQCGYACSDHASWHRSGYPASFAFEAPFGDHSPFIHTPNDTLAQSGGDARRSVPFAKLGAAYMAELAKGGFTARPAVAGAGTIQRGTTTEAKAARLRGKAARPRKGAGR